MNYDILLNKLLYVHTVYDSSIKMNDIGKQILDSIEYMKNKSKHDILDWEYFERKYPDVAKLVSRI